MRQRLQCNYGQFCKGLLSAVSVDQHYSHFLEFMNLHIDSSTPFSLASVFEMPFTVLFRDSYLDKLDSKKAHDGAYSQAIVKAFRKVMQLLRSAIDERDLLAVRSLKFERLQGDRQHQHSMRLNDQWRLIVEIDGEAPNKTISVICIEDYH
ncbi:MAG: type II toxin-antitoxin system RelE/ParE family toxin [Acidobacteria bacterium]|nr:type II toxin-antitoxin system RelE/ParE family toxin [Acidobacteriota bacterium]